MEIIFIVKLDHLMWDGIRFEDKKYCLDV